MKKRLKVPQEEKDKKQSVCGSLSKKELLHLLGVMEGEVQVTSRHVRHGHHPTQSCSEHLGLLAFECD